MRPLSPLRFFLAMHLHAGYALAVCGVVTTVGVLLIAAGPAAGLDDAMGMLLFVQMFLASSGFIERARRGHFDSLLTSSSSRVGVIAAHGIASSLPGAFAWMALVGMAVARGGHFPIASGGALFIVSAVAWTAGFALARGTAGFLWTAALFALLMRNPRLLSDGFPLSVLFCPFLLLRPAPNPVSAAIAIGIAFTAVIATCRFASRLDLYLLERQ